MTKAITWLRRAVFVPLIFGTSVSSGGALQAPEIHSQLDSATGILQAGRAPEGIDGVAVYYSKRYEGRRTTSGERYRSERFTAAHPHAPLGTLLRVVHAETGKEVVVRVNDRCRKRKVPFIDLSRSAARELGFLGKGKARVRIVPMEKRHESAVAEAVQQ